MLTCPTSLRSRRVQSCRLNPEVCKNSRADSIRMIEPAKDEVRFAMTLINEN